MCGVTPLVTHRKACATACIVVLSLCFAVSAAWYKGDMHIHMQGSGDDGVFASVQEVVDTYKKAGYSFVSITGHNVIHDSRALNQPGTFVTLVGVELHNYAGTWCVDNPGWTHVNSIGCREPGPVNTAFVRTLQDQINMAIRLGGIAQINHPLWQGGGSNAGICTNSSERVVATTGATLMELQSESIWDAYLSSGRQIYATLNSDNHTRTASQSRMVVVDAPSFTSEAILNALKRGNFIAQMSNSITIQSVTMSSGTLSVQASTNIAGLRVEFVGKNGAVLKTVDGGTASYTLTNNDLYVRARMGFNRGAPQVFTQALFRNTPPTATPPVINNHPSAVTVNEGAGASFSVSATGTEPLSYQWQKRPLGGSFADIPGAFAASYTTPPASADINAAQLRCVVSNNAGSATSNAATLTVRLPARAIGPGAGPVAHPSVSTANGRVIFTFGIHGAVAQQVRIRIHDIRGRAVCTVADERAAPGNYFWQWEWRDNRGGPLPGGAYVARVRLGARELSFALHQ